MSNIVKNKSKDFFSNPAVQEKIKELVGKNAPAFTASVLQIVNSNSMLIDADPKTVFSAACMAATLNLPINNSLGFAYLVPFNNRKEGKIEAQFMIGWKGYVQLAQRSGQFERIATTPVYSGQLVEANPLLGYKWDWAAPSVGSPIGYVAFFKLINGFTAELYMSKDEIQKHANKYSQTARKGYGVWKDNFDAMALKTVLKLLLSKQAPLSIEMQSAVLADQAIVRDVDNQNFDYIDHNESVADLEAPKLPIGNEDFSSLIEQLKAGAVEKSFFDGYQLTEQQQSELVNINA